MSSEDPLQSAKALLDELQGEGAGGRMYQALAEDSPEFAAFAIASSYAVYSRPGLDVGQRQLVTLGVLAALGGCDAQIERHTLMALNAGLSPEQIVEACIQVAIYAGQARANNAFRAASNMIRKVRERGERDV